MSLLRRTGKLQWIFTWMSLLALLVLGISNFQGTVLCFESDGQVSLESAIGGLCSASFQETQTIQKSPSGKAILQTTHCKHCVDVSFSIIGGKHQEQGLRVFHGSVDIPMPNEVVILNEGYLATATQQQLSQPPPLRLAVHRFLSTIVLLI